MSEQNSSKTTQLPLTENENLLAGQCETVETPVPAASPETTGQRLVIPEPSTDSVDKSQSEIDFDDGVFEPCSICGASFDPYRIKNCGCADFDQCNFSSPLTCKIYPNISQVRHTLREERRLKNSRVKGLSS